MRKHPSHANVRTAKEESKRSHPPSMADNKRQAKKKYVVQSKKPVQQTVHDAPTAVIIDRPKTQRDHQLIMSALNKHFIFTCLPDDNKLALINQMKLYSLQAHEYVFQQNQLGSHFFIVASGKLEVIINKKRVKVLGPEDNFGELALVHDTARSATIKTIERATLWGLDRKTFRAALSAINRRNYEENKQFIENVPSFKVLTAAQKEALLGSLSEFKFRRHEVIVKEGDPGDLFYLIKEGTVACTQENRLVRELTKGEFFGEQALLYNSVRTATVTAVTEVSCVVIGRERLNFVFGDNLDQVVFKNSIRIALDKSQHLSSLDNQQKERIAENMQVHVYRANQVIIQAGALVGAALKIVLKGSALQNNQVIQTFSCIGDAAIQSSSHETFRTDLIAVEDCEIAEISETDFKECILVKGETHESTQSLHLLKKVQLFRGLPVGKLKQILAALKVRTFNDNERIVAQGARGDSFFIVKSGLVDVIKNGAVIRTITHLDYFGERSLLNGDVRTASVVARNKVVCWELGQQEFMELFDDRLRHILTERIELQDESIQLSDLSVVRLIGKGSFGNVYQVIHKYRQTQYALKCVRRDKVEQYDMQNNVLLERRILLELDHTLIVKLVKTFKDEQRLYFLQELVMGEELFEVLRILDVVSEDESRFYTACLVLIIEHLHERNIVYRDLKPENVMVDKDGYPKLIDFGISKILSGRTYTVVGTPHYMAPEMITGRGYSLEVDWYALGIMLYEFMFGNVPFGAQHEDPYEIYEETIKHKLTYPPIVPCSSQLKVFIEQLIDVNPASRLRGGIEGIKQHTWLTSIDWDALIIKEKPTPFQPRLPDLSSEISRALSISSRLSDALARDEERVPLKKRRGNAANREWDQEF